MGLFGWEARVQEIEIQQRCAASLPTERTTGVDPLLSEIPSSPAFHPLKSRLPVTT